MTRQRKADTLQHLFWKRCEICRIWKEMKSRLDTVLSPQRAIQNMLIATLKQIHKVFFSWNGCLFLRKFGQLWWTRQQPIFNSLIGFKFHLVRMHAVIFNIHTWSCIGVETRHVKLLSKKRCVCVDLMIWWGSPWNLQCNWLSFLTSMH